MQGGKHLFPNLEHPHMPEPVRPETPDSAAVTVYDRDTVFLATADV